MAFVLLENPPFPSRGEGRVPDPMTAHVPDCSSEKAAEQVQRNFGKKKDRPGPQGGYSALAEAGGERGEPLCRHPPEKNQQPKERLAECSSVFTGGTAAGISVGKKSG